MLCDSSFDPTDRHSPVKPSFGTLTYHTLQNHMKFKTSFGTFIYICVLYVYFLVFCICNYICILYLHYHCHNDQITHFCQMSEAVVRKMRAGLCMQQRLCHLPWHLPLHLFSARNFLSTSLRIFCKKNPFHL